MTLIDSFRLSALVLAMGVMHVTTAAAQQRVMHAQTPVASDAGQARKPRALHWMRSELYFGLGGADASQEDRRREEAIWREFLDKEVTPRFPDGLTVLDGYGQWMASGGTVPERLQSKVLLILHENTPRRRADIEAIRSAWKRIHGDESVLWSMQPAWVSF